MDGLCYIQVILPIKLEWEPWYSCTEVLPPGSWVKVRLAGRQYTGIVHRSCQIPELDPSRILPIESIESGLPRISSQELKFWEFLAEYYMCTIGEVFKNAYPGNRTRSEQVGARKIVKAEKKGQVFEEIAESATKPNPTKPLFTDSIQSPICKQCIDNCLEAGLHVLVLVPEIDMGRKTAEDLENCYPKRIMSVSSDKTALQRRKVAEALRYSAEARIITGTRLSLFLPFRRLGLVVVTDEHDSSYRQSDPAPRFNTRDAAIMLAKIHNAKAVLCSPAPSLETWCNILNGKYENANTNLTGKEPQMEVIDVSEERRKNGMVGIFSRILLKEMEDTEGRKLLIRGWEKDEDIQLEGMDADVMTFYEALHSDLAEYALIAVLQADFLLSRNDFRADERAIQTLKMLGKQCVGKKFIVQTSKSGHQAFGEYRPELLLQERKDFKLPPYSKIIDVVFNDDKDKRRSFMMSRFLCDGIRYSDRIRVTLPANSSISQKKAELWQYLISFEKEYKYTGHIHFDVDPQ